MAATLTYERFTGPEWTFERKYDGIRLLAFKRGDDVRLYSRNQLLQRVPAIASAIARLPHDELILDGELAWDQNAYHVFDVLWFAGRDLRSLALEDRRRELASLPLASPLHRVAALDDAEPWRRAAAAGWEGVIAKRRDSVYESRRSPHWLKMKIEASQELVVGGFTDPRGKRRGLGALLVGYFEGQQLVFAGKVGTGLDTKLLLELRARLDTLAQPTCPFERGTGFPRSHVHWVRPEVVVQVGFMEWTSHDKLRHPRLIRLREDKLAHDVTRER
ncbi:MAG: putative ligase-like protein [Myxococcales bacterium]|nr:putative ligase-like protein [Myxococcales bacterium]